RRDNGVLCRDPKWLWYFESFCLPSQPQPLSDCLRTRFSQCWLGGKHEDWPEVRVSYRKVRCNLTLIIWKADRFFPVEFHSVVSILFSVHRSRDKRCCPFPKGTLGREVDLAAAIRPVEYTKQLTGWSPVRCNNCALILTEPFCKLSCVRVRYHGRD